MSKQKTERITFSGFRIENQLITPRQTKPNHVFIRLIAIVRYAHGFVRLITFKCK